MSSSPVPLQWSNVSDDGLWEYEDGSTWLNCKYYPTNNWRTMATSTCRILTGYHKKNIRTVQVHAANSDYIVDFQFGLQVKLNSENSTDTYYVRRIRPKNMQAARVDSTFNPAKIVNTQSVVDMTLDDNINPAGDIIVRRPGNKKFIRMYPKNGILDKLLEETKQIPDTSGWKVITTEHNYHAVEVPLSDPISQDIINLFAKSAYANTSYADGYKIKKIVYMDSKLQWEQYTAAKMSMENCDKIGKDHTNETWLFHGTEASAIYNNHRLCIADGGLLRDFNKTSVYGPGTYFATQSSYSLDTRYSYTLTHTFQSRILYIHIDTINDTNEF